MGLNTTNQYVSGMIGTLETEIMTALQTAADRVRSGAADAAMTRWFGDTSLDTKTHVTTALTRMRTNLNCQKIDIAFTSIHVIGNKLARKGYNAAATLSTSGLLPVNSVLPHYAGAGFTQSNMWLDEGFSRLPTYLPQVNGAVDATGGNQSRFNTLVHELSHLLLGTVDCVDGTNVTMYGTQNAELLALHGLKYATSCTPPFAALYNAENWGIFVEAAGRNKGT